MAVISISPAALLGANTFTGQQILSGTQGVGGALSFATAGSITNPNSAMQAQTGTDAAGLARLIAGGLGTGAGAGGSVAIATPTTLATGATAQTFVSRLTVSQGAVTTDAFTVTVASGGTLTLASSASNTVPSVGVSGGAFRIATTDSSAIIFGTNATNRFQISATASTLAPVGSTSAATSATFSAGNVTTATDAGAGTLTLGGQVGTGAGAGGSTVIQSPTTLGTGTTAQTAVTRLTISQGAVTTDAWNFQVGAAGSVICAPAAIATTATFGFLYIPSCAGTPTGVPATKTGTIPLVYDSTNSVLYAYSGGNWVAH